MAALTRRGFGTVTLGVLGFLTLGTLTRNFLTRAIRVYLPRENASLVDVRLVQGPSLHLVMVLYVPVTKATSEAKIRPSAPAG